MSRENKYVKAFSEAQIWVHKHLIHFTVIFLITGLPLIEPDRFGWVAAILGSPFSAALQSWKPSIGLLVARWMHRAAAVGLAACVLPYFVYELTHVGSLEIWPEEWSISALIRGVRELIDYYIKKEQPDFGKYNLGQKAWTWAVIVGLPLMYASGVVMWLRDSFSPQTWRWAHAIHDIGFFVALAFLLVHVYLALLIPEHRPAARAIFRTGDLPLEFAKKHHPKWIRKLGRS